MIDSKFQKIISQFPDLLKELHNSPLKSRNDLKDVPQKGIYVFYDKERPIYVGRSNKIKTRIQQHSRQGSTHNSASFAFNLAKEAVKKKGIKLDGFRINLEKDPVFTKFFSEAKKGVSKMRVRVIKINGPINQALFEIYIALAFKTKFNDFNTH